jgi:putative nucleotidyltransferase with HDIG domain
MNHAPDELLTLMLLCPDRAPEADRAAKATDDLREVARDLPFDPLAKIDEAMERGVGSPRQRSQVLVSVKSLLSEAVRDASLRTVGLLLERRDLETKGHTDRVVALADRLAEHLGLAGDERRALRWGAYLHDIGKIALPDRILFKPDRLTEREFAVVRQHVDIGCDMLVDLPFLPEGARELVRHHHERWNGRGYPARLAGEAIPLLPRLFSLVDVYDALSSKRPYKAAWPRERALDTIRRGAGREFDPEIAGPFVEMIERADAPSDRPAGPDLTAGAGW